MSANTPKPVAQPITFGVNPANPTVIFHPGTNINVVVGGNIVVISNTTGNLVAVPWQDLVQNIGGEGLNVTMLGVVPGPIEHYE